MREVIDPKDKRAMEKEIGRTLSDFMLSVLMRIDGDYSLEELQNMCRINGLIVSGNKRQLAYGLLLKEINNVHQ